MKGIILLILGLILAGTGLFVFSLRRKSLERVAVESFNYDQSSGLQGLLQ